jgi:hypothetical protein
MDSAQIPTKVLTIWAADATSTYVRPVPVASQQPGSPNAASFAEGFPADTFTPTGAGGLGPDGRDMNGILQLVTAWNQWQAAGGPVTYDPTFSSAEGGYPLGAFLTATSQPGFWLSLAENNTSDPDTGGANWQALSWGQSYAGNPNGNVAGTQATANYLVQSLLWDSTDLIFWVCTTTGDASTAVWKPVSTLTTDVVGLLKGNGLSISAAVPGTDYLSPTGGGTVTIPITFAGSTTAQAARFVNATEVAALIASAPGSTFNFAVQQGAVQFNTVAAANNWTINFKWSSAIAMNAALVVGDTITVSHLVTQGATAYYPTAFQIDGSVITPQWQGGIAPNTGDINSVDVYTFTIIKTASAAFTVIASQTKYA